MKGVSFGCVAERAKGRGGGAMKVTRVEGARVETEEEPRATCVNGTPREEPELTGDDGGGGYEGVVIEES